MTLCLILCLLGTFKKGWAILWRRKLACFPHLSNKRAREKFIDFDAASQKEKIKSDKLSIFWKREKENAAFQSTVWIFGGNGARVQKRTPEPNRVPSSDAVRFARRSKNPSCGKFQTQNVFLSFIKIDCFY